MNNHITSSTQNKVTDLSYLKSVADNDFEFIQKMVESFITQTPVMLTQIQKSLKNDHWQEIAHICHKMRPLLVFMGLNEMKAISETIEKNCIEKTELDSVPEMSEMLSSQCQLAFAELSEDLKNNTL